MIINCYALKNLNISNLGLLIHEQKDILETLLEKFENNWGLNNNLIHLEWTEGQD